LQGSQTVSVDFQIFYRRPPPSGHLPAAPRTTFGRLAPCGFEEGRRLASVYGEVGWRGRSWRSSDPDRENFEPSTYSVLWKEKSAPSLRDSRRPHRHGRACPGHPRRPMAPLFQIQSAPDRLSIWAACEPDHVDGRDKPGHDGKGHGKQNLTSLFLVSAAKQSNAPLPPLAVLDYGGHALNFFGRSHHQSRGHDQATQPRGPRRAPRG
jgi:hypothetical protein